MRVIVVAPYYKPAYFYGGPVRSLSGLCEALSSLGTEVTVLTTNANGAERLKVPLARLVKVEGVKVYYFPFVLGGFFSYAPALPKAFKERVAQADLAVLEGIWGPALGSAARACLAARVPYVVPLRGQLLPWSLRQKSWKKKLYLYCVGLRSLNGAAALHCTDPFEAEAARDRGLKAPTVVVPNGVDSQKFARLPERRACRQRWGIPEESLVILFLGRLHHKKRPDIALEVLAAAQSLPQAVHLLMAGPDEERITQSLQNQAHRLGCAHRLHLPGLLSGDEVLQALAVADLMVMPSEPESENFGMSAVEALAAGVPVVVSDGVPMGGWIESAGAGRSVPCQGQAFARACCELLSSPERLASMGEQGRALARQRFDLAVVARQMLRHFQALVATGIPASPEA